MATFRSNNCRFRVSYQATIQPNPGMLPPLGKTPPTTGKTRTKYAYGDGISGGYHQAIPNITNKLRRYKGLI